MADLLKGNEDNRYGEIEYRAGTGHPAARHGKPITLLALVQSLHTPPPTAAVSRGRSQAIKSLENSSFT
jgi:hypothetical protein